MRIMFELVTGRADDALLILETVGFVADDEEPSGGGETVRVSGDLPEKSLSELQAIDGIRDWKILPADDDVDAPPTQAWPWRQKPETD